MEIRWYWLAERLGYYTDYGDGMGAVDIDSARGMVLFCALFFTLLLFVSCFVLRRFGGRRSVYTLRAVISVLLVVGLLKAVGIGPYVYLYPLQRSSGFIDLSEIENIAEGVLYALFALVAWLGGRLGQRLKRTV